VNPWTDSTHVLAQESTVCKEVLFVPDVAHRLGLLVPTVWNYVGNPDRWGRLPPFSRNADLRRITWRKQDVDAWIENAWQTAIAPKRRRPGRPTKEQSRAMKALEASR